MDPFTHALLGACAAQVAFGRRLPSRAWLIGAGTALVPDLDFFIHSDSDPLLNVEMHRQFSHALAFIPVGGLLAGLPWLLRRWARAEWRGVLGAAVLAYATHGLLDACTNYGTQLLWPFSNLRVAWHLVTTVGPPVTLMLLFGLLGAVPGGRRWPAALGLLGCLSYLAIASWQQERGQVAQASIALARGHTIARAKLFPTVGNPVLWRSVYEADGVLHTDRLHLGVSTSFKPGSQIALSREASLPATWREDPRVLRDFRRFAWFSDGWVARSSANPEVLGDARYSLSIERFEPIWGIRFHPEREVPTEWVDFTRQHRVPLSTLWREISGRDEAYRPLPDVPSG